MSINLVILKPLLLVIQTTDLFDWSTMPKLNNFLFPSWLT